MGGTSTDVSLIQGSRPETTTEAIVHGYPLKVPMIDIHTVGAGGGSIAYVDSGGFLKVGPRSAGAAPGPICYGLGNDEPTVTDANVVMQVLNPTELLGGRMKIDQDPAIRAIELLGQKLGLSTLDTAAGIVRVVTANMARASRLISIQRGHDPRDYSLMPFGGGGPVHAGRLARELGIPRILVPRNPGILCAMGLLLTDQRHELSGTRRMRLEAQSGDAVREVLHVELPDQSAANVQTELLAEERETRESTLRRGDGSRPSHRRRDRHRRAPRRRPATRTFTSATGSTATPRQETCTSGSALPCTRTWASGTAASASSWTGCSTPFTHLVEPRATRLTRSWVHSDWRSSSRCAHAGWCSTTTKPVWPVT